MIFTIVEFVTLRKKNDSSLVSGFHLEGNNNKKINKKEKRKLRNKKSCVLKVILVSVKSIKVLRKVAKTR